MAIPLKGQRRKMLTILRSLALIKGDIGKVLKNTPSFNKHGNRLPDSKQGREQASKTVPRAKQSSIKRRVGYGYAHKENETRKKREKMNVDEENTEHTSIAM
jgi:hypothetical protein